MESISFKGFMEGHSLLRGSEVMIYEKVDFGELSLAR